MIEDRFPDINERLRARLREAIVAEGIPDEDVDQVTDELLAIAEEHRQRIRKARES